MTNRYSLKTRFAFTVFPGNVQHVGTGLALDNFQPGHLILVIINRLSINPGAMGRHRGLLRQHGRYGFELNMCFRGIAVRILLGFQKYGEDLNGLKRFLGYVSQLQENSGLGIKEPVRKSFLRTVIDHEFAF
jgi:hypothetical protein